MSQTTKFQVRNIFNRTLSTCKSVEGARKSRQRMLDAEADDYPLPGCPTWHKDDMLTIVKVSTGSIETVVK